MVIKSINNSSKLKKIVDIVKAVIERDEKVVIFSQWAQFIYLISDKLLN